MYKVPIIEYKKMKGGVFEKNEYMVTKQFIYVTIVKGFEITHDDYTLEKDGTLVVNAGYLWDGATGALDTDNIMLASCVHDIFCEIIGRNDLPVWVQALADEELLMITRIKGMSWYARMHVYFVVRFYQLNKKRNKRETLNGNLES
jgi:hypothetical protein